ncbi:MAG: MFS transporter [Chloroflexi bacterium]|nr:MFS transporter [Chloroflexota bacterium]
MRLGDTARGLSTLYGTSLLVSFGFGMTIPTIPLMVEYFDVSLFWGAQIVTAWSIGALIGTPPAGIIVDKLGARVALLVGPMLIIGGALTVVLSPWFWLVLIAMAFAGMGNSTWMIGREIAGVGLVKPEQRGRMMSGFMGTNTAGMALGPALGGVLGDHIDFRAVFLGYTIAAVFVLALSLLAPVKGKDQMPARVSPESAGPKIPFWSPKRIMGIPALVREIEPGYRATYVTLVFATFMMMLYRMVLQSMLPLYVVLYRGFSASELGFLLSLQGIFVILMIIPAGLIMDKVGRKWATVPSTALPAISFALMPIADSLVEIAALLMLLGFASGLSLGSVATSTYDVIPAHARGRLQALRRTTSEVGGITGPLVGGRIATIANPGVAFLAAAPLLVIAALLLAFVAKETLNRAPRVIPPREAAEASEAPPPS